MKFAQNGSRKGWSRKTCFMSWSLLITRRGQHPRYKLRFAWKRWLEKMTKTYSQTNGGEFNGDESHGTM